MKQRIDGKRSAGVAAAGLEMRWMLFSVVLLAAALFAVGCTAAGDGERAAEEETAVEPVSPTALAAAEAAAAAEQGADSTDSGDSMDMDMGGGEGEAAPAETMQAEPVDHSDPNHTHEAMDSMAVRFGEEIFGANSGDYGASFTPDGDTVFFTRALPDSSNEAIFFARRRAGGWDEPQMAPFSGRFHDKEPYVAPDGGRLYFASRRPVSGVLPREDLDIWFVELGDDRWGDPVHVDAVSSPYNDDYPAVAADGTLVFARNDEDDNIDLWIAHASDGGLDRPRPFARPINTVYPDADPWIAAAGDKIVFSSPRLGSEAQGQGDLYVIHRLADGWTPPASLGTQVNSIAHEYGPELSAAGDAFYFSRGFGGQVWTVPVAALDNFDGDASR